MTSHYSWIGLPFANSAVGERNVVTTCKFCGSNVSFRMKLLHGGYCSDEHKEAYFEAMDRLGLERLIQAQPLNAYQPCTKPVDLARPMQEDPMHVPSESKTQKFVKRPRPHLELAQGEAAVAGV